MEAGIECLRNDIKAPLPCWDVRPCKTFDSGCGDRVALHHSHGCVAFLNPCQVRAIR